MHHSCSTDFAPHKGLFHWGVMGSHPLGKERDVTYLWINDVHLMMHNECEDGSFDRSDLRNRLNSSCRSLLVRRSFFLKGAQKRDLAIS